MTRPRIDVLGVYKLPVTDDLVSEQCDILYVPASDEDRATGIAETRKLLNSVVLVEALVRDRDKRYDVADFTQPYDNLHRSNWPAAYSEVYLSLDGESVIEITWPTPPEGDLRVAFYLHDWDPTKPLYSSYGEVQCPPVKEMPERLQQLAPFEPFE